MISRLANLIYLIALVCGSAMVGYAQFEIPDASSRTPRSPREDGQFGVKEMLAKQRVEREKKDYEEMLERGDEAAKLMKQLEISFEQNHGLMPQDRTRLDALERVVIKIRKDLGGGDDDARDENPTAVKSDEEPQPTTMQEAFQLLQSTTSRLVDELKKTTRFSISAAAIQSSNTALKLLKFLRLKK